MKYIYFLSFLIFISCNSKVDTRTEEASNSPVTKIDSTYSVPPRSYQPQNVTISSFRGDVDKNFNLNLYIRLLENDSIQAAIDYLELNKPATMDSTQLNTYKSNLATALIHQAKFTQVIDLLGDAINSRPARDGEPFTQRFLRAEAYVQVGDIDKAFLDLTYITEHGLRYSPRAYRQRGLIKLEILKDTVAGCKDMRSGVSNDHTLRIYKSYCEN